MTAPGKKFTYRDAGVNIDEGMKVVDKIKARMKGVVSPSVLSGIGGFGGIVDISHTGVTHPVLVSSIDGVGTKTKIAAAYGKYNGIGKDIVGHCVNDIAVQGARPLFFLDYIGVASLDSEQVDHIIAGIIEACRDEDCILIGGETAEMPGVYCDNEFDLVGCIIGIMEKDRIITGKNISEGNAIIGLPSAGIHTNGFSMVRKVLLDSGAFSLTDTPSELTQPLGDELLIPHRCYGKIIRELCDSVTVNGMAHITGGGLIDNIPRILPDGLDAVIDSSSWNVLPIFSLIQNTGHIDPLEMYRVFNMGIGLTIIVDKKDIEKVCSCAEHFKPTIIGEIAKGERQVKII